MSIDKISNSTNITQISHSKKEREKVSDDLKNEQERNLPSAEHIKGYANIQTSKDCLPVKDLLEKMKEKGIATQKLNDCLTDKNKGIYARKLLTYILSDNLFSNDKYLFTEFDAICKDMDNQEKLDAKLNVLEYIKNNEKLSQDENIIENFIQITWNVDSSEKAEYTKQIFDKVISTPELEKNENIKNNLVNMTLAKDSEVLKNRLEVLDNFANNATLQNNQKISSQIGEIVKNINSETSAKFVQKYLFENEDFDKTSLLSDLKSLTKSINTPEKLQVFEALYNNEKTRNSKPSADAITGMFKDIKGQQIASAQDIANYKINLLNTLSNDDKVSNNLSGDQIFTIVKITNTPNAYNAKTKMIDNINNIDGLFENTNDKLFHYIGLAQDDFATHIFTKILSNKELANDKNVTDNLDKYAGRLLPTQEENVAKLIEEVLDNKELRSNQNLIKNLSMSFIRDKEAFDFMNEILIKNKDKYEFNNESDYENVIRFAKLVHDEESKNNVIKFYDNGNYKDSETVDKILNHWTQGHAGEYQDKAICLAMSSPAVINSLIQAQANNSAFYDTKTEEQANAKMEVIREFINNKNTQKNSAWGQDSRLWIAIYNTETQNAAEIVKSYIKADSLLENKQASDYLLFRMTDDIHKANSEAWENNPSLVGYTKTKIDIINKANEAIKNNKNLSEDTKYSIAFIVNNTENYKDMLLADTIFNSKDLINNDSFMQKANGLFYLRNTDKIIEFLNFYKDTPEINKNTDIQENLYDIVNKYNPQESIQKYSNNPEFIKDLKDTIVNVKTNSDVSALVDFYDYKDKVSIHDLDKKEKRQFMTKLMQNKNIFSESQENICSKIPLLPKDLDDYAKEMKQIAQSLNLTSTPISEDEQKEFKNSLNNLANNIQNIDLNNIDKIDLKFTQKDFINEVQNQLKDLPKEEQIKIQDYFGFKIEDNKLSGYPAIGKNIDDFDIKDEKSREVISNLNSVIENYTNNNEIETNNPELSEMLNNISKTMPELYNQMDGNNGFVDTLKSLQNVCKNDKFKQLNNEDKQVVLISALLNNTDKKSNEVSESAFDAFFISKRLGMNDNQAQKVYSTINASNNVEKFMELNRKTKDINITMISFAQKNIVELERDNLFNKICFDVKDSNKLELAQILYSSKYPEGFTRHFDKIMQDRIDDFKSKDFIMPQTSSEDYDRYSQEQEIEKGNNKYNVKVAYADDIPDFYAYVHTPEAGYCTGGSRSANLANFDAFQTLNDDKIICTGYIANGQAGLVEQFKHGFILNVDSDKQYVGSGGDMFSLSKNIPHMISEYYSQPYETYNSLDGKRRNRQTVSNILKNALYGAEYSKISEMLDNKIQNAITYNNGDINIQEIKESFDKTIKSLNAKKQKVNDKEMLDKIDARILSLTKIKNKKITEYIINQNIDDYNYLKEIDKKYIERIDNLKIKSGNKNISLSVIEKYDSELAQAYKSSLLSDNWQQGSIMAKDIHNEFLVSNPQVSAIFTNDIYDLPEEYLQKSQEENIPIVIIK